MALILAVNAYAAEKYIALDNRYNITGYVTFDDGKAYMEVEDEKGNASCFVGDLDSSLKATNFVKNIVLQFETQNDELWVTSDGPSANLTCGKGPVKFDRIIFKKEMK